MVGTGKTGKSANDGSDGMSGMIRVDLHAHTRASPDAWTSPAELVSRAAGLGLDRIAITDHGHLDGALAAKDLDPARIIVGIELRTSDRMDLIGLFVHELLPEHRPAAWTAAAIREQGGIVYVPHPFAYLTNGDRRAATALALADVIEVFNSRAFRPAWNRKAQAAASSRGLPAFASSDAHFPWEIGRAWTELPAFSDARTFLEAAKTARPCGQRIGSPTLHLGSMALSLARGGRVEI
jgi:hypothetical protein